MKYKIIFIHQLRDYTFVNKGKWMVSKQWSPNDMPFPSIACEHLPLPWDN